LNMMAATVPAAAVAVSAAALTLVRRACRETRFLIA
jgi:hypothetical protein